MKKILIINNANPEIFEFTEPVAQIVKDSDAMPVIIEYANSRNYNFSGIKGAILTGSPKGDDIVEHHQPFYQWLKSFTKPVLGICAGHHITGFLYGAKLLRSEEPEEGDNMIKITLEDPIFKDFSHSFLVKQMHNDSITLPDNFKLLATSDTCINQMMKHKTKPLYTCQFHPEFYNHKLIRNFIRLC